MAPLKAWGAVAGVPRARPAWLAVLLPNFGQGRCRVSRARVEAPGMGRPSGVGEVLASGRMEGAHLAHFGGDGETGRDVQAQASHLAEVGALAAQLRSRREGAGARGRMSWSGWSTRFVVRDKKLWGLGEARELCVPACS